jgi:hypothetical protein
VIKEIPLYALSTAIVTTSPAICNIDWAANPE